MWCVQQARSLLRFASFQLQSTLCRKTRSKNIPSQDPRLFAGELLQLHVVLVWSSTWQHIVPRSHCLHQRKTDNIFRSAIRALTYCSLALLMRDEACGDLHHNRKLRLHEILKKQQREQET